MTLKEIEVLEDELHMTGKDDKDSTVWPIRIFRDGNMWCAVWHDTFKNLQESEAAFGVSKNDAAIKLIQSEWRNGNRTPDRK